MHFQHLALLFCHFRFDCPNADLYSSTEGTFLGALDVIIEPSFKLLLNINSHLPKRLFDLILVFLFGHLAFI